jgi:dTDP-4-amino-4,6-dideoxygalactose transaminase
MLNFLVPYVLRLRNRYPKTYAAIVLLGTRLFGKRLGIYPRNLAGEIKAAAAVLRSSRWNMTAGNGLAHERLEAALAEYVGVNHAIAVGTGGLALQMSMRALGLKPGDEVIHQVDTCSATALAVMAAGCTPIFSDISDASLMLNMSELGASIGPDTRALVPTHMWGNPENIEAVLEVADRRGLKVIEDACLALGATINGRKVGSYGHVGVFSFGCIKPIQGGEGGAIVTNDEALARELRSMRHWGDRAIEYGVRDTVGPAWNGRMSEIVAAVVAEQLKGYPSHLAALRESVGEVARTISSIDGLQLVLGHDGHIENCSFTQVVLKIDSTRFGVDKQAAMDDLRSCGVPTWHANFEPITTLSLFKGKDWIDWLPRADVQRVGDNYRRSYSAATRLYREDGFGLGKMNFLSRSNVRYLVKQLDRLSVKGCK